MSVQSLLRNLGYGDLAASPVPPEAAFHHPDVRVALEEGQEASSAQSGRGVVPGLVCGRFVVRCGEQTWQLHSKVVLDAEQLQAIACIAMRFAPVGSTVSLQADTHNAGNVFVGMIMSFGANSIPVNLVSGDIGCGLTVLPVVAPWAPVSSAHPEQLKLSGEKARDDDFHTYALATMRASLVRGRAAEEGFMLNTHLVEAASFYGEAELAEWLNQLGYVLDMAGFDIEAEPERPEWAKRSAWSNSAERAAAEQSAPAGLTLRQVAVLRYVGRFAQTLGCAGNHFMELATDDRDHYWLVVHSGSRGLGAKVYDVVAQACRVVNEGLELATGALAEFYAVAYSALNKFAKLNRVLCAVAVLKGMSLVYQTDALREVMRRSYLFAPAIAVCNDEEEAMLSLISGLTHNGIKAFVNDEAKQALFVLSKGAVAMSRRAAASIVALRAGDGCYLWTLADPASPWHEVDVSAGVARGYTAVHSAPDVVYSGHGAGRSQSATKTEKQSTFADLVAFYDEHGMAGNVAPGVLGDNPRIAYNSVEEIVSHLPLDIACTKSLLRTRVSYKEGICYKTHVVAQCAEFVRASWAAAGEPEADGRPSLRRLWFDLAVCRGRSGLTTPEHDSMRAEQQECLAQYLSWRVV